MIDDESDDLQVVQAAHRREIRQAETERRLRQDKINCQRKEKADKKKQEQAKEALEMRRMQHERWKMEQQGSGEARLQFEKEKEAVMLAQKEVQAQLHELAVQQEVQNKREKELQEIAQAANNRKMELQQDEHRRMVRLQEIAKRESELASLAEQHSTNILYGDTLLREQQELEQQRVALSLEQE